MNIIMSGRNIELTEAIKRQIIRKLGKLDKFFPESNEAHVTVAVEKNRQILEITIPSGSLIIRAEVADRDLYASIDKAVDVIERQIRKHKTRLEKRLRSGALATENYTIKDEIPEEKEFHIVKSKTFNVKPMAPDEAILQMNLLGHEFYVFVHDRTDAVCVVYKRNDGDYGMIETQR